MTLPLSFFCRECWPKHFPRIQSIGRRDAFDAKSFEPHAPDDSVTAMDGDSSGSNIPGHAPGPAVNPQAHAQAQAQAQTQIHANARGSGERSEGVSDPGSQGRPRKFVIQSTFGVPRERRSRKSRPCDACRRRKTACIITTEPPCKSDNRCPLAGFRLNLGPDLRDLRMNPPTTCPMF